MPATFVDAAGKEWQVYQVRRTSHTAGAVSPGREAGWLAFASGEERRRLAPFPEQWESMNPVELERLCEKADRISGDRATTPIERRRAPRINPAPAPDSGAAPRLSFSGETAVDELLPQIQSLVRARARNARSSGETVIGAMMEMRSTLLGHGIQADSESFRAARRLFLEVFYFQRER